MNTTPLLICCATAAALLASGSVRAEDNLIPNPGFEEGSGGWVLYVSEQSQAVPCRIDQVNEGQKSGAAAGAMISENFASFSICPEVYAGGEKVLTVQPGSKWKLSFWIRSTEATDSTSQPAFFVRFPLLKDWKKLGKLIFIGANGAAVVRDASGSLDIGEIACNLPAEWTHVEAEFQIPNDVPANQLGRPEFYARGVKGPIFLDDISLSRVETEAPQP